MLRLSEIFKQYGKGEDAVKALTDINLEFADHGFVTILGPSGCGKTTLLNIIGGLDQYTSGDLIIDNKSTKTFKAHDWDAYRNHRIGFVFQSYNLIPHLSVSENVEMSLVLNGAPQKVRKEKAANALEMVGLDDQKKKRPNQMSGGQMQRTAIARALVNDPDIILADEPTGALDSETSIQIMDILKVISKKKLIIMVTHNDAIADQYADRIIRLKDGQVISDTHQKSTKKVDGEDELGIEHNHRTSMGVGTAMKLSLRNLGAKKGRTVMSSVAGSVGILGVALVLALSSGFQAYIDGVEGRAANSVPITISLVGERENNALSIGGVGMNEIDESTAFPDPNVVQDITIYNPQESTNAVVHYNRFSKEYIDYVENAVTEGLAQSVLVNYSNMKMNLLSRYAAADGYDYKWVNEGSNNGLGITESLIGLPNTIYHELYGEEPYISASYDVLKGHYPKNANEVVLIVDRFNRVSASIYNNLGLGRFDPEIETTPRKVNFDDLIGHEFKIFYNNEMYEEIGEDDPGAEQYTKIETNANGDPLPTPIAVRRFNKIGGDNDAPLENEEMFENEEIGEKLTVSGILRVKEEALMNLMSPSIGYTRALKEKYLEHSLTTPITEAVFANAKIIDPQAIMAGVAFASTGVNPDPAKYSYPSPVPGDDRIPFTRPEQFIQMGMLLVNPVIQGTTVEDDEKNRHMSITDYLSNGLTLGADLTNQFSLVETPPNPTLYLLATLLASSLTTSIAIFPNDLVTKPDLFRYLDQWNETHNELEQIYYSDLMGTVTDGIGTMIQIISAVLIVFASLALVVSSVMTAIITYVSVIERKKEIGVLRALGARKFDVGFLFETETVITGFISGTIGILVTYLLSIPINIILNNVFPDQGLHSIASLPWWQALVLIFLSMALTFVAGFIPSRIASKKDPVESLRSE